MSTLKKFRHEIPEIYRWAWDDEKDEAAFNLHLIFFSVSYDNFLREFARLQLYGYFIAASFLQILHDPEEIDFNNMDYSLGIDFFIQKAWRHGGEVVNYELAALVYDMYKLHQKLNIDLE